MKTLILFSLAFLAWCNVSCAANKGRVALDPVTSSTVLDGDATAIVEGCEQQPIVGFTYCRFQEGESAYKFLWFIGPPSKCDREACVYIKVWNGEGNLVWGGSIPKDKTRVSVSWKTLLSAPTFDSGKRGFWTFNEQVYWKDPDGRERVSTAQGDIVVRVYRSGYLPLDKVANDPSYVWKWYDNGFFYQMTSGLRAFVKRTR